MYALRILLMATGVLAVAASGCRESRTVSSSDGAVRTDAPVGSGPGDDGVGGGQGSGGAIGMYGTGGDPGSGGALGTVGGGGIAATGAGGANGLSQGGTGESGGAGTGGSGGVGGDMGGSGGITTTGGTRCITSGANTCVTTASGGVSGTGGAGTSGGAAGSGLPPEVACPPHLGTAKPPIMLEATLGCQGSYGLGVAPTSVTDSVYVAVPVPLQDTYIAKIAPSGISIQAGGFAATYPILFLDHQDAPRIVAASASEIGLALWTPGDPSWSHEVISPGIVGPYGYIVPSPRGVLLASNGQPRVLYGSLHLGERSPDGTWSDTTIVSTSTVGAAMVLDSLGRTRILYRYYSQLQFEEWIDGTLLDGYPQGDSHNLEFAVAINTLSPTLGVVRVRPDAIAMNFSNGASVSSDLVIDNVTPFEPDDCGHIDPYICDSQGVLGLSLAATDDGVFWLAYVFRHKNFNWEYNNAPNSSSGITVTADHSLDEVRLFRVSPSGSPAPVMRWSYRLPFEATNGIRVVARGARLYMGIEEASFHVFSFDWKQL